MGRGGNTNADPLGPSVAGQAGAALMNSSDESAPSSEILTAKR